MTRCPICAKNAEDRSKNPASPFCSPACKLVDLGRWLDGTYRLPAESSSTAPEEMADEQTTTSGLPPSQGNKVFS